MAKFAADNGFALGEVREVEDEALIYLTSTAPDRREFRVSFLKG